MFQELAQEQLIRSFLLGELPESEQELIEERLVTDQNHDFFDKFLIIEGELLDDYVLGHISERERVKLESGLLKSPHEYRKVEFVKTLEQYIAHTKAAPPEALRSSSSAPSVFTRLRSWLLDSVPAPLIQSPELGAAEDKANNGEEPEQPVWEQTLHEAHANRSLIFSLMSDNWLGMELLLQLKVVQQATLASLASLLERDESSLESALVALSNSGLVLEHQGEYSCSEMGNEVLDKIHSIIRSP